MKLEDKFFNSFFYPFLISVFFCTLVVTIFLSIFTNNNLDKKTRENLINLEKKYSNINIKNVNVLLTTSFQKIQASLNEQILFYQKIATKLLLSENEYELDTTHLKNIITLDNYYCENESEEAAFTASWIVDNFITEKELDNQSNKVIKNQLIAFSNIIPNSQACLEAIQPDGQSFYYYFESTELYISYPVIADCETEFFWTMKNTSYEDDDGFINCLDKQGNFYDVYKFKCEIYYVNIIKSKSSTFDNNYLSNQHRTIFITNFYGEVDDNTDYSYTMCISFKDPITKGNGYICTDITNEDMVASLENLNSKIIGYYFVSNVGFNNVFYFPQGPISPRTSTESVYNWNIGYNLDEKSFYNDNIKKILSSNYIDYIGGSIYDEIFINGKNSSNQEFFINGKKFKYSIYPVLLENLDGKREHLFSLIYVYKEQLYIDEIENYNSSLPIQIILELILIVVFGFGLLYLVYLSFNILAKYIVIPIKTVSYMLKGINIGGENRLDYLDFLKKKQDDNLEKLEKMYLFAYNKDNNDKSLIDETENDIENLYENEFKDKDKSMNNSNSKDEDKNKINQYSEFNKKYDEESNNIEKEFNYYDYDDQLLQYRPLEIENLVKSLMNLKGALLLTSSDREIEQIIDYSCSEEIFRKFKNEEGAIICQSNIGNLQSQLLKFDKSIYHLALSLQDNKLNKFLSRSLSDELDESDSLLNIISNSYNKEKKKIKKNILVEKQQNNSKNNFSQKIIGILINTRYCRLIHAYYMFFKNLQKLRKLNNDKFKGQFMNTSFHTINYYHKIIIQFIYLSYIKNDLVKIGESILDYLEFLIKFKFKTSSEDNYFLKLRSKDTPKYREKQGFKKIIFNKILKWFNLFDDYISYVKDNSSLADPKSIIDDYCQNLNSENTEFNLESQSAIMFRVNMQKSDFLKAKFCLYSKNYNDSLFYFIRAAKRKCLVIDGLIKKRSLKHIYKLLAQMSKKYENLGLNNIPMEKELKQLMKEKNKLLNNNKKGGKKKSNREKKEENDKNINFRDEIEIIKNNILQDISECNAKQAKDIIILIDFNIYDNKHEDNLITKSYKIDMFIDQTIVILNNYLSTNDRISVFIYANESQIICPLLSVNEIDRNNFSKDLLYYKNSIFKESEYEFEEYDLNLNEIKDKPIKLKLFGNNNFSEHSQEDSSEKNDIEDRNYNKLTGFVKAINNINNYSKIKEAVKNEKYIIIFTDIFSIYPIDEEKVEKIFKKLNKDKEAILLLVGKNKHLHLKKEKNHINANEKLFEELILNQFGEKSELINFENMKKIKPILSNNNVIKDEIIYPNEIYK